MESVNNVEIAATNNTNSEYFHAVRKRYDNCVTKFLFFCCNEKNTGIAQHCCCCLEELHPAGFINKKLAWFTKNVVVHNQYVRVLGAQTNAVNNGLLCRIPEEVFQEKVLCHLSQTEMLRLSVTSRHCFTVVVNHDVFWRNTAYSQVQRLLGNRNVEPNFIQLYSSLFSDSPRSSSVVLPDAASPSFALPTTSSEPNEQDVALQAQELKTKQELEDEQIQNFVKNEIPFFPNLPFQKRLLENPRSLVTLISLHKNYDKVESHIMDGIARKYSKLSPLVRVMKFLCSLLPIWFTITWSLHHEEMIPLKFSPMLVGVPMLSFGLLLLLTVLMSLLPTLYWDVSLFRRICKRSAGYWSSWVFGSPLPAKFTQVSIGCLFSIIFIVLGVGYVFPIRLLLLQYVKYEEGEEKVLPPPLPFILSWNTKKLDRLKVYLSIWPDSIIWFFMLGLFLLIPVSVLCACCFRTKLPFLTEYSNCLKPIAVCVILSSIVTILKLGIGNITHGYFLWTYAMLPLVAAWFFLAAMLCWQTLQLSWKGRRYAYRWLPVTLCFLFMILVSLVFFVMSLDFTAWVTSTQQRVRFIPLYIGVVPLVLLEIVISLFYFLKMVGAIHEDAMKFPCSFLMPISNSKMMKDVV